MTESSSGPHGHDQPVVAAALSFGRVDDAGNVFVRTGDGERFVGQWAAGDAASALTFYSQRFEGLVVEAELLERRVAAGSLSPEDAMASVRKLRANLAHAQAVGDFDGLAARLDQLVPVITTLREKRKAERAARTEEAKRAKEQIALDAERIAASNDWRDGANKLRDLLTAWKTLARVDKATDDALWHRFSSARTTYTRRRKQHFAELGERRDAAREEKQKLVAEAEELATSRDWGPTAAAFRDLMTRWKAAGSAAKLDDDALWKRFRAAQDTFFSARDAENARTDTEYAANADVKRGLLAQAEKLLPVKDPRAARETFRDIAARWDAAGKVPRSELKDLESRFKRVEQAVRGAEDDRWRRSNPETQARAAATVGQLEASIANLQRSLDDAIASGDTAAAEDARASIQARQSWLDEARKSLHDLSP